MPLPHKEDRDAVGWSSKRVAINGPPVVRAFAATAEGREERTQQAQERYTQRKGLPLPSVGPRRGRGGAHRNGGPPSSASRRYQPGWNAHLPSNANSIYEPGMANRNGGEMEAAAPGQQREGVALGSSRLGKGNEEQFGDPGPRTSRSRRPSIPTSLHNPTRSNSTSPHPKHPLPPIPTPQSFSRESYSTPSEPSNPATRTVPSSTPAEVARLSFRPTKRPASKSTIAQLREAAQEEVDELKEEDDSVVEHPAVSKTVMKEDKKPTVEELEYVPVDPETQSTGILAIKKQDIPALCFSKPGKERVQARQQFKLLQYTLLRQQGKVATHCMWRDDGFAVDWERTEPLQTSTRPPSPPTGPSALRRKRRGSGEPPPPAPSIANTSLPASTTLTAVSDRSVEPMSDGHVARPSEQGIVPRKPVKSSTTTASPAPPQQPSSCLPSSSGRPNSVERDSRTPFTVNPSPKPPQHTTHPDPTQTSSSPDWEILRNTIPDRYRIDPSSGSRPPGLTGWLRGLWLSNIGGKKKGFVIEEIGLSGDNWEVYSLRRRRKVHGEKWPRPSWLDNKKEEHPMAGTAGAVQPAAAQTPDSSGAGTAGSSFAASGQGPVLGKRKAEGTNDPASSHKRGPSGTPAGRGSATAVRPSAPSEASNTRPTGTATWVSGPDARGTFPGPFSDSAIRDDRSAPLRSTNQLGPPPTRPSQTTPSSSAQSSLPSAPINNTWQSARTPKLPSNMPPFPPTIRPVPGPTPIPRPPPPTASTATQPSKQMPGSAGSEPAAAPNSLELATQPTNQLPRAPSTDNSPTLAQLENELFANLERIDVWTQMIADYPSRKDSLRKQVERVQEDIFKLQAGIRRRKRGGES